ncbi:MAG: hypothetical protein DMG92_11250 [Acidobacteria bacterium]|nr:MAG: hypothetical protein DMG92_11250 [Acidobacteriota bacterium]
MNSDLEENLSITLSKAAWLVLFELLATSNAEWNKTNPDSYSTSAKPLQLKADHPERVALCGWSVHSKAAFRNRC